MIRNLLAIFLISLSLICEAQQIVNLSSSLQPRSYNVPIVGQYVTESYENSQPFLHLKSFESLLGFTSMEIVLSIDIEGKIMYLSIDQGGTGNYYQVYIKDWDETILRYAKEGVIELYFYPEKDTEIRVEVDRFNLQLTSIDKGIEFTSNFYQAITQTIYPLYVPGKVASQPWYYYCGVME